MKVRWCLVLALFACSDDGSPPMMMSDASGTESILRACDGRAYDPCTDTAGSTDCMSGTTCHMFAQEGITLCSPTCDASTPCPPDEAGNTVSCNNRGLCRANVTNTCAR